MIEYLVERRELGPEMTDEGWIVPGGDHIYWLHPSSSRSVSVEGPIARGRCGSPCWGPEPASPETRGYWVACREHDEHGNPVEGKGYWVESYGVAVRQARALRRSLLEERADVSIADQIELAWEGVSS
ncbi:MAG TPA: hypothetical protein VGI39_18040 [Polyangiaceae bacterium]